MAKLLKQFLLLLAMSLMVVAIQAAIICPKNQEFELCGTACPPRCSDDPKAPKFCTLQCVIGCQCKRGYLLNSKNQCVKPHEC